MAYAFNPFTGKLDLVGSGGSATTDASLLTSGTLADARLSSNVSLDNQNNAFTAGQSITAAANTSALTASYSVTGANTTPLVSLTGTWNTTGVAQGILLDITDTASSASSTLFDLRTSGTSRFAVRRDGVIMTDLKTAGAGIFSSAFFRTRSDGSYSFSSNSNPDGANDLFLLRDSAGTLAQRNVTNAQTFRLYNTFTDASNFERGFMRWNANVLEIGTEAGGTGGNRDLRLTAPSTNAANVSGGIVDILSTNTYVRIRRGAFNLTVGLQINDLLGIANGSTWNQSGAVTYPALKRSSTTLQVRLANDSDFAPIQGRITTETAYTATPITPTGFITIYDSTGTAYKVACSL